MHAGTHASDIQGTPRVRTKRLWVCADCCCCFCPPGVQPGSEQQRQTSQSDAAVCALKHRSEPPASPLNPASGSAHRRRLMHPLTAVLLRLLFSSCQPPAGSIDLNRALDANVGQRGRIKQEQDGPRGPETARRHHYRGRSSTHSCGFTRVHGAAYQTCAFITGGFTQRCVCV